MSELFAQRFGSDQLLIYQSRPDIKWRFNILLQNVDRIPQKEVIGTLQKVGSTTATIAHKSYATAETAERLGCPIHFLSWRLSPDDFDRTGYASKKKLIVISPDIDPDKAEVVHQMSEALPDHHIVQVQNMTYEEYRHLIKHAKFCFTFGEGLDAYFIESIFYGGISMAIFNNRFFTPEYRDLDGVFDRREVPSSVFDFLRAANGKEDYEAIADRQYSLIAEKFNQVEYKENVRTYYATYFPEWFTSGEYRR
jgi:hypothetical protein